MTTSKPVLIVGAGPTGLTAAVELSRQGIPVRLIDKQLRPSTTSRALAVQPRTLELLEPRGVAAEMIKLGRPGRGAVFHRKQAEFARVSFDALPSRFNYILLLPQSETERLLTEKAEAQGVRVERGSDLVAISQTSKQGQVSGVEAVVRRVDGSLEEIQASYLISAEGAHSLVRETLGLQFEGKTLEQRYALADLYIEGEIPGDELSLYISDHGFAGFFPIADKRFRVIVTSPKDGPGSSPTPSVEDIRDAVSPIVPLPLRFHDMYWSSKFVINSRHLSRLRVGNIFFGGDSAHIHSPAGGQGMNTGIQDMINLGWKLAQVLRGEATPELLDTYESERLPIIRDVVKRTEFATEVLNSTNPLVSRSVAFLMPLALDRAAIQDTATRTISQISWNYRKSRLSLNERYDGDLRAGDRVPDIQVSIDGKMAPVSLQLGCKPDRFTLLLVNGHSSPLASSSAESLRPWRGLIDVISIGPASRGETEITSFQKLFGHQPYMYLVRPDGYLGAGGANAARWPSAYSRVP